MSTVQTGQSTEDKPKSDPKGFSMWLVIKNAMSSFLATFFVSIIGFLLTPLIIHQLGNEQFGVWTLIFSIVSVTELADFGIGLSLQRKIAQHAAQNEPQRVVDIANQAFTTVLGIMLLISIPLFGICAALPMLFKIPPHLVAQTQISLILLTISMVILLPLSILGSVITGYQKYDLLNINWIGFSALRAFCLVVCVFLPNPLISMSVALLVLALLRFPSLVLIIKHLCPSFKLRFKKPDKTFFTEVAAYGSSLFLISILSRIIYTTDTYMIGILMSTTAITFYTIGAKWSDLLRTMLSGSLQALFPAFSHLSAMKDELQIRIILIHGSRLGMGLGILGASLLILMAEPIIYFWVGPGYTQSVPIMRWLGMVGVITSFMFPFDHYLRATGKTKILFRAALFNAIVNIIVSLFLIPKVGIIGAVWGTLSALIPTALFLTVPAACKLAGISKRALFIQVLSPLILPLIWIFCLWLWLHFFPMNPKNPVAIVLWGGFISLGYLGLWMMLDSMPRGIFRLRRIIKA